VRAFLASLVILFSFACHRAETITPTPAVKLIVRFLDADAVFPLPLRLANQPGWGVMNAGAWEPVEVRWSAEPRPTGSVALKRTSPDWVLVKTPEGDTLRVVMRGDRPETLESRRRRFDEDDQEALTALGILWALFWASR
jgi:hypothetical protein